MFLESLRQWQARREAARIKALAAPAGVPAGVATA